LSEFHNLALVRLGRARTLCSEPLVAKCLELFQTAYSNNSISSKPKPKITHNNTTSDSQSVTDLINSSVTVAQDATAFIARKDIEYLKRALTLSDAQHDLETRTLATHNDAQAKEITALTAALAETRAALSALDSAHVSALAALETTTAHRDDLATRTQALDDDLAASRAAHTDVSQSHESLLAVHAELVQTHGEVEREAANVKLFFEAQVAKLKAEVETANNERDAAGAAMTEAQAIAQNAVAKMEEMERTVQSLNAQLARATEKYKKSRAKELEDEIARLEQIIASLTAETQFLKSLLTVAQNNLGESKPKKSWSFLERKN
ncbi:hypothetical protein HK100_009840, partial [Physocladia obscura]